ncbi:MAG: PilT/PilU family type 4a pilus ATPase [Candidatus Sumerlaeota bacterium]|nr:PilT/PilU family type 4a pilus ATPase [Candidatus Sumerlaeota bacterium]
MAKMPMAELTEYLRAIVEERASDLFLKAGDSPIMRVDGEIVAMRYPEMTSDTLLAIAQQLLGERRASALEDTALDVDMSFSLEGLGRFRVNLSRQRGQPGLCFRYITRPPESFSELNLPPVVAKLAEMMRGLVLVTGTTGSGKSTTLAAIVNYINRRRPCHIVTIEDPIEFTFEDDRAIVSQREVGSDTVSFREALRRVLRQSPDVIFIGEMRDVETIETAIAAAETGHLVLSTLHTMDAAQTIERIINYFPTHLHQQIRMELSLTLKGVISQRLLPRASGRGRIPAVEVMVATPTVAKLLFEGKTLELPQAIADGEHDGMQTFNHALLQLFRKGEVTREAALSYATSSDELRLMMEGITTGAESALAFLGEANKPNPKRI